jgi:hypothetical protein
MSTTVSIEATSTANVNAISETLLALGVSDVQNYLDMITDVVVAVGDETQEIKIDITKDDITFSAMVSEDSVKVFTEGVHDYKVTLFGVHDDNRQLVKVTINRGYVVVNNIDPETVNSVKDQISKPTEPEQKKELDVFEVLQNKLQELMFGFFAGTLV